MDELKQKTAANTANYWIIDIMKGICALWVIMLHGTPAGNIRKTLLLPFYAQITIPFFMVISGFTYSLSMERHDKWYTASNLGGKLRRLLLPFVPALLLELIVRGFPEEPLEWLLSGGYKMPGSYYVALMVQLVLLFPAIEKFYDWWHEKKGHSWKSGIVLVFGFHCVYELFTYITDMESKIYRLLVFRYIIFLYMGIVLYKMHKKQEICWKSMLKLLPLGFIFILAVGYLNWQPKVLFRYYIWYRSSAPVVFWVAPIMGCLIANGNRIQNFVGKSRALRRVMDAVQLMGKASYHIYIVQMLWFGLVEPHLTLGSWRQMIICAVSMVVCSAVGVLYYYAWNRKKISAKTK